MIYQSKITGAVSALGLFLYPLTIQAEAISSDNSDLPQIVVTATKTANTVDETLAPVTIITREDIQRSQANSVMELLMNTPGIDFTSSGGLGSRQGIHMRGTNSSHVLVLIDGVTVGSSTTGTTSFQYLPISQIKRIEVVRGPHSSIYGSSAIGGVIQIFTNNGQKEQKAFMNIGYGSDNTKEVNIGGSSGNDNSTFSINAGYLKTDGYNFIGDIYPHNDDDGFKNTSFSLGGSHQLTKDCKLRANFLYSEGRNDFDSIDFGFGVGSQNPYSDYKEQITSLIADYDINNIWMTQLQIGQSIDESETHSDDGSKSLFKTTKATYSWKNELIISDTNLLTLGVDYLDESIKTTTDFTKDSRWNKAVFTQYQYYSNIFDFKISGRHDDNENFGSHNTGSFSVGFDLDEYVRITTSYGSAFNAPTFNDLYFPDNFGFKGNPDLKPEESESFDFGVDLTFGNTFWTAHYYHTQITNLIEWGLTPENINKAKINGFELTLQTHIIDWDVRANASFTNPVDEESGDVLNNRSKNKFRLDIDKNYAKFSYGTSVIAASERFYNGEKDISGYAIMNIRGVYHIAKNWTLKAKINNLFNKIYATNSSNGIPYKTQDRYVFASIHYEM